MRLARGMAPMKFHILGGWAYPPSTLSPLADLLGQAGPVHVEPFTHEPAEERDGPWCLVGWSLGGLKALRAVIEQRVRPAGLVLISSSARFCRATDYACGVERGALRAMMMGLRRDREQTLARFFADAASTQASGAPDTGYFPEADLMAGLRDLDTLDLRDSLGKVAIPALLLHGARDRIIPAEASHCAREHLPNARLFIHPDAGHDLPAAHAGWAAEKIHRFVSDGFPCAPRSRTNGRVS